MKLKNLFDLRIVGAECISRYVVGIRCFYFNIHSCWIREYMIQKCDALIQESRNAQQEKGCFENSPVLAVSSNNAGYHSNSRLLKHFGCIRLHRSLLRISIVRFFINVSNHRWIVRHCEIHFSCNINK